MQYLVCFSDSTLFEQSPIAVWLKGFRPFKQETRVIVLESRWPGLRQTKVPVEEEATRDSNTIEAFDAENQEAQEKHNQPTTTHTSTNYRMRCLLASPLTQNLRKCSMLNVFSCSGNAKTAEMTACTPTYTNKRSYVDARQSIYVVWYVNTAM
jgi:hypothetical protein